MLIQVLIDACKIAQLLKIYLNMMKTGHVLLHVLMDIMLIKIFGSVFKFVTQQMECMLMI